jgi:hypothetical protein
MFKIKKARETGNIQYLESILLEEIEDLQERKEKIKARMEQFYPELKVQAGDSTLPPIQNSSTKEKRPTSQRSNCSCERIVGTYSGWTT